MPSWQRQGLMLLAAIFAFGADMLSKAWANSALEPGLRHIFVPSLLNLILVNNTGLAFSMVNDNGLLAKTLAGSVFIVLLYFYGRRYFTKASLSPTAQLASNSTTDPTLSPARDCRPHPTLEQLGMAIVIGAAASNLFERLLLGHVTDFLEFAFVSFPIFNLADVLIDTGIGLVLLSMFLKKNR